MSPSTDRQSFREIVAQVAERARAILPQTVNGRIEGAIKLVLAHDVTLCADGSIEVGSCTDPLKVYRLVGQTCECKDFTDGKAPDGWCRHRIAAGIDKRVRELLPEAPEPEPQATVAATVAPAALAEAPASVNCHIMLEGRQVQLTLRDTDEERLLTRLTTILQRYPIVPSHTGKEPRSASGETPDKGQPDWCPIHNCAMQENEKDGRRWFSHRSPEGQWCKGRRSR
jgi:hypothetical protein